MNDFEQRLTELRVYGFTVVPDVLSPDEVVLMRKTLADAAAQLGVETLHRGTARHLANLITIDPVFFRCVDHPQILPWAQISFSVASPRVLYALVTGPRRSTAMCRYHCTVMAQMHRS